MLLYPREAVVVAYDMYLECATGNLNGAWKVEKPVDFFTFREALGIQMLQYSPSNRKYPGDEAFRVSTQEPRHRRKDPKSSRPPTPKRLRRPERAPDDDTSSTLTPKDLQDASGRLCGLLDSYCEHVASMRRMAGENSRQCQVCGKNTYEICGKCNKALHYSNKQGGMTVPCFLAYHNTSFFGLSREDSPLVGRSKKQYKLPEKLIQDRHAEGMKNLHELASADLTSRPSSALAQATHTSTGNIQINSHPATAINNNNSNIRNLPDNGVNDRCI